MGYINDGVDGVGVSMYVSCVLFCFEYSFSKESTSDSIGHISYYLAPKIEEEN